MCLLPIGRKRRTFLRSPPRRASCPRTPTSSKATNRRVSNHSCATCSTSGRPSRGPKARPLRKSCARTRRVPWTPRSTRPTPSSSTTASRRMTTSRAATRSAAPCSRTTARQWHFKNYLSGSDKKHRPLRLQQMVWPHFDSALVMPCSLSLRRLRHCARLVFRTARACVVVLLYSSTSLCCLLMGSSPTCRKQHFLQTYICACFVTF